MAESREQSPIDPGRWTRELPALLTLVCGFAASVAVFGFGRAYEERQIAAEFQLASEEHVSSIEAELSHDLDSLAMVATLLATYPQMDRARFRRLVAPLLASRSSVQALEWAPRIQNRDRAGYEERVRNELPGYRITEQSSSGEVVRAAKREEYFPVHFVEPLSGNEPAVGFDLASEAVRREALARARDLGNGAATAPLEAPDAEFVQGMLEGSNVKAVVELTRMIQVMRSYQGAAKLIESEDERSKRTIQTLTKSV